MSREASLVLKHGVEAKNYDDVRLCVILKYFSIYL